VAVIYVVDYRYVTLTLVLKVEQHPLSAFFILSFDLDHHNLDNSA